MTISVIFLEKNNKTRLLKQAVLQMEKPYVDTYPQGSILMDAPAHESTRNLVDYAHNFGRCHGDGLLEYLPGPVTVSSKLPPLIKIEAHKNERRKLKPVSKPTPLVRAVHATRRPGVKIE